MIFSFFILHSSCRRCFFFITYVVAWDNFQIFILTEITGKQSNMTWSHLVTSDNTCIFLRCIKMWLVLKLPTLGFFSNALFCICSHDKIQLLWNIEIVQSWWKVQPRYLVWISKQKRMEHLNIAYLFLTAGAKKTEPIFHKFTQK